MEVLLQDWTGEGAHATKLYGDFLLSLCNPTPITTTTTTAAAPAAAAFFIYHLSLITFSHSLPLRPLLLHTHATRSSFLSQPTKPKFPSIEGNFFHSHPHSWQHYFFQISRHFQISRRRGGSQVTGEVEGVILILRKSLPPPEQSYPYATHSPLRFAVMQLCACVPMFERNLIIPPSLQVFRVPQTS